jgi:hypothetical protein
LQDFIAKRDNPLRFFPENNFACVAHARAQYALAKSLRCYRSCIDSNDCTPRSAPGLPALRFTRGYSLSSLPRKRQSQPYCNFL